MIAKAFVRVCEDCMKKTLFLSLVGLVVSAAHAESGRIYLSSGDRQVNMTYQAPAMSDDDLDEAINRLTANAGNNYNPSTQAPRTLAGMLDANSAPAIAARIAKGAAHKGSIGRCALYVRKALQAAGYKFTSQASAYMYANGTLAKAGFTKIDHSNYTPQLGDVVVFNRTSKNPHGHIQIYDGKGWVSDFHQNKFSPYSKHNGYSVWRDSRYLDASNTNGTYLAYND